jgi:hypothetical protein
MVRFEVISVSKHSSSDITTIHYSPNGNKPTRTEGGEWEDITLRLVREDQPTIQVAGIIGDIVLNEGERLPVLKLRFNNPKLFGTFKIGDIASLEVWDIPRNEKEESK